MNTLALIVAANAYGGIGFKGDLPWRLDGDLAQFKAKTLGQVVVIGRNTDASIPRRGEAPAGVNTYRSPLPGRIVITVSSVGRECVEVAPDYWFAPSFEDAVRLAKSFERETVFFAGGKSVYEAALPIVDVVYLTCVYRDGECDVHVEGLDFHAQDHWRLVDASPITTYTEPLGCRRRPSHAYHRFERIHSK